MDVFKSLFELFTQSDAYGNAITTYLPIAVLLSVLASLLLGLLLAFLCSLKLRATKSFFITTVLMPVIVASIIGMLDIFLRGVNENLARIVALAVALGLVRFRSVNGRAEEILILFASVAIGFICGLGYVLIALLVTLLVGGVFVLLSHLNIFSGKKYAHEKVLKITIPENLEYSEIFDETFKHYLKSNELIEVKTTGMGSLFRLTYKIVLKNEREEKELIDELRTKNGNLEISVLPFVGEDKVL